MSRIVAYTMMQATAPLIGVDFGTDQARLGART